jgi:hypothetical protein
MVPIKLFDKHQSVFCELILKFKNQQRYQDYEVVGDPFIHVIKEVMDSMPNKKNLEQFFSHEAIQCLWSGLWRKQIDAKIKRRLPYRNDPELVNYIQTMHKEDKDKLHQYCLKLN